MNRPTFGRRRATRLAAARATATLMPIVVVVAALAAFPSASGSTPCPPLTGLVDVTPLPPRVGMSGSVTPLSPSDSAMFVVPVPFAGNPYWGVKVRITINVHSMDLGDGADLTYGLYSAQGANAHALPVLVTCADPPYLSEQWSGPPGIYSTTIQREVLITDSLRLVDFHLQLDGQAFADWTADLTPCYTFAC